MTASTPGSPLLVARLVWASMLAAVALYGGVLAVLVGSGSRSPSPAPADQLRTILLVLAAGQTLVIWFVWRRFVAPSGARDPADRAGAQRTFAMHVICWALGEAIALYGLVIGLITRRVEPVFFV